MSTNITSFPDLNDYTVLGNTAISAVAPTVIGNGYYGTPSIDVSLVTQLSGFATPSVPGNVYGPYGTGQGTPGQNKADNAQIELGDLANNVDAAIAAIVPAPRTDFTPISSTVTLNPFIENRLPAGTALSGVNVVLDAGVSGAGAIFYITCAGATMNLENITSIQLLNGATGNNIFWIAHGTGGKITFTGTSPSNTIADPVPGIFIARTQITFDNPINIGGRVFAREGDVQFNGGTTIGSRIDALPYTSVFTLLSNTGITKVGISPITVNVVSGFYGDVSDGSLNTMTFSGGGTLHNNDTETANAKSAIIGIGGLIESINAAPTVDTLTSSYGATTLTINPGKSVSASTIIFSGTTIVFDAGGNPDAQFMVVSTSSYISFNLGTQFILRDGAKNTNIFWLTDSGFGFNSVTDTIYGTFITPTGPVAFNTTPVTVHGRVYAGLGISFEADSSVVDPAERSAPLLGDLCFLRNTLINTDQGVLPISLIKPDFHTIDGQRIVAVTETAQETDDYLVCFEKDSMGPDCPNAQTIMSPNHAVLYNGSLIRAHDLVNDPELSGEDKVHKVPYASELLYNILMDSYGTVTANNMVCETLDPEHRIAQLYKVNMRKHVSATACAY
jgi:hypothetical protein